MAVGGKTPNRVSRAGRSTRRNVWATRWVFGTLIGCGCAGVAGQHPPRRRAAGFDHAQRKGPPSLLPVLLPRPRGRALPLRGQRQRRRHARLPCGSGGHFRLVHGCKLQTLRLRGRLGELAEPALCPRALDACRRSGRVLRLPLLRYPADPGADRLARQLGAAQLLGDADRRLSQGQARPAGLSPGTEPARDCLVV